jgi:hypothetical protein
VKSIQVEKELRQAQLEHLQEYERKMLTDMDTTKGQMEKFKLEFEEMPKEHLTAQTMEFVANKSA